jgi:L-lactate dehydrogenase complex protein LldG
VSRVLHEIGAKGIVCESSRVRLDGFTRVDAAEADCGITDAEWGVAATGTLVLPMIPGRTRSASLLPPVHLAILDGDRILPDVPAVLSEVHARYMAPGDRPSSVVFVTGPSRTADIELNLVLGVHGPRRLWIVIVCRASGAG